MPEATIKLPEDLVRDLDELKAKLGASSRGEVVRVAVKLLKLIQEGRETRAEVVIRGKRPESGRRLRLEVPW
ncbi:hypothetical protein B6U99_07095 [Candidatus Geothermarchaeota archaeon ex4572_27]|nr:MAG: hypothetical protein B6U99_07095 [Candidatus Geothermarchaeota archaeon ex4572_27]